MTITYIFQYGITKRLMKELPVLSSSEFASDLRIILFNCLPPTGTLLVTYALNCSTACLLLAIC